MSATAKGRKAEEAKLLRENLRAFTNGFKDRIEEAMRPQGMTIAQLRLLYAVQQDPEASSAAIARACQVTPQTLQAMLQRAVRERWLVRRPAAHNARILNAALTAKGEAMLQRAKDAVEAFESYVWRGTSIAQLQSINAWLADALQRMEVSGEEASVSAAKTAARAKSSPGTKTAVER